MCWFPVPVPGPRPSMMRHSIHDSPRAASPLNVSMQGTNAANSPGVDTQSLTSNWPLYWPPFFRLDEPNQFFPRRWAVTLQNPATARAETCQRGFCFSPGAPCRGTRQGHGPHHDFAPAVLRQARMYAHWMIFGPKILWVGILVAEHSRELEGARLWAFTLALTRQVRMPSPHNL